MEKENPKPSDEINHWKNKYILALLEALIAAHKIKKEHPLLIKMLPSKLFASYNEQIAKRETELKDLISNKELDLDNHEIKQQLEKYYSLAK